MSAVDFILVIDLLGTFAFAVNGAFTALRTVRLDIVGVLVLGMITAIGGGIIRDVLIGAVPPVAFTHWYYLAVAGGGALLAFFVGRSPRLVAGPMIVLDAVGLSLFCVTGAQKALDHGLDPTAAIIIGAIAAIGGGTIRDVIIGEVPSVLTSGLYAIPALVGAAIAVLFVHLRVIGIPVAAIAAIACFAIRMLGVRFNLNAPKPPRKALGQPD